jgi:hypothetical protein
MHKTSLFLRPPSTASPIAWSPHSPTASEGLTCHYHHWIFTQILSPLMELEGNPAPPDELSRDMQTCSLSTTSGSPSSINWWDQFTGELSISEATIAWEGWTLQSVFHIASDTDPQTVWDGSLKWVLLQGPHFVESMICWASDWRAAMKVVLMRGSRTQAT